jgi:hypothetical protein
VPTNVPMGWATYSPDGTKLVVANRGVLTLRDAQTGKPIGPDMGKIPLSDLATHPDWSPDGEYVAIVLAATVGNMDMKNGSIARIPYNDGAWGPPELLVPATSMTDNNYFPKYSPDGSMLAYVNANGSSRGAPTAELRLVRASPGGVPIPLGIASHRVGRTDGVPDLANTMPTWSAIGDDGIAWLAFASVRPYGAVRPMIGSSQIWITGIDLSRTVGDPSFAAFWLPCQDITDLANNPIWAPTPNVGE